MEASFGTRLRQQRERHGIELAAIAEQTKIKLSLLQELERDNLKHWPTGIFRRSWVRNYARAIGANEDAVVQLTCNLAVDLACAGVIVDALAFGPFRGHSGGSSPSNLLAADSPVSSSTCTYRAVVRRSACPSRCMTAFGFSPASISHEACVCRTW